VTVRTDVPAGPLRHGGGAGLVVVTTAEGVGVGFGEITCGRMRSVAWGVFVIAADG
jgi:hypothetical protein